MPGQKRRRFTSLKRKTAKIEPKKRFFLFCEGKNTEPTYFYAIRKLYCIDATVCIETIAPSGVPLTLANAAVKKKKELLREKNSFSERDEVWAVFDRDEHPNFAQAVSVCENSGVKIGRSNPCFEVWLILHREQFDRPDDRHAVQSHYARLDSAYNPNGAKTISATELINSIELAEQRAEAQLIRRVEERNAYGCPSTTVSGLTKAIREAAKNFAQR